MRGNLVGSRGLRIRRISLLDPLPQYNSTIRTVNLREQCRCWPNLYRQVDFQQAKRSADAFDIRWSKAEYCEPGKEPYKRDDAKGHDTAADVENPLSRTDPGSPKESFRERCQPGALAAKAFVFRVGTAEHVGRRHRLLAHIPSSLPTRRAAAIAALREQMKRVNEPLEATLRRLLREELRSAG
jgi:hypothetical protein